LPVLLVMHPDHKKLIEWTSHIGTLPIAGSHNTPPQTGHS
jgi:hypothetical protein